MSKKYIHVNMHKIRANMEQTNLSHSKRKKKYLHIKDIRYMVEMTNHCYPVGRESCYNDRRD